MLGDIMEYTKIKCQISVLCLCMAVQVQDYFGPQYFQKRNRQFIYYILMYIFEKK